MNGSVKPVIQMSMLLKSSRAMDARISVAEHIRALRNTQIFSRKSSRHYSRASADVLMLLANVMLARVMQLVLMKFR